jgi:hypothetical protein
MFGRDIRVSGGEMIESVERPQILKLISQSLEKYITFTVEISRILKRTYIV